MPDTGEAEPCDLVTVPAREGLEAADILRLRHDVGPVLHDREGGTLGFVVPPGTAAGWDLPGSDCAPACAGGAEPPIIGSRWLVPPAGAGLEATEPDRLRAALHEAVTLLDAVDRCQSGRRR